MLARHHLVRALMATLVLVGLQGGCLGACGECNDCGECGLVGGPNESSELHDGEVGLDGMVPTAELLPYIEGECAAIGAERTWLGWVDGTVTTRQPGDDEELTVDADLESSGAHRFGQVTIRVEEGDASVRVTFNPADADEDVVVECALDAEDRVVCDVP